MNYVIETLITFKCSTHARIVMESIDVEGEMRPDIVDRKLSIPIPTQLSILLSSNDIKKLRMSSSSLMEMVHLSSKTIEEFQ